MKVVIQSPVEHDGKALAAGDEVDMPKDAAEALVAVGIAEVVIDAKAAKAAAKAAAEAEAAAAEAAAKAEAEAAAAAEAAGKEGK
jgi:hypothetical protein